MRKTLAGMAWAIVAGVLFGLITVVAKAADAPPLAKAAIGAAAAGLLLAPTLGRLSPRRAGLGKLAAMVVFGGVLAPVFILYGLESASAVHAGLLLTLELVATAVLGLLVLHERLTRRTGLGLAFMLAAAAAVALAGPSGGSRSLGLVLVGLAALAWSVDNIVGARLAAVARPMELIAAKSLAALVLLVPAWAVVGFGLPAGWQDWAMLAGGGAIGVGLGSVAFYSALRTIGAARTGALCLPVSALTAAAGGAFLLGEPLGLLEVLAMAFVAGGIVLLWEPGAARASRPRRNAPQSV